MIVLSLHLPAKLRLDVKLVKRRKSLEASLMPNLRKILRARTGNKFSRFFRHVFENNRIKKFVGTNFAVLMLASSFIPSSSSTVLGNEQNLVHAPLVFTTQKGIGFPLDSIKISQGFRFYHPGIDFDALTGDPVKSVLPGVVQEVGYSRFGYGYAVEINHGGSTTTLYAHLSKIDVVKGQRITAETKIGEVGATGRAFGDHLHFEVRENGNAVNPTQILNLE